MLETSIHRARFAFLLILWCLAAGQPVAQGQEGYALEVSGSTVTINDEQDVLRLGSYTYEFWLKDLQGPTGSWRNVFCKGSGNSSSGRGPLLALRPNEQGLHYDHSTGSGQSRTVFWYDGSARTCYVADWTTIPGSDSKYRIPNDCSKNAGGWPTLSSTTPPLDSDHDGMPNDWELARGLNPGDSSDSSQDRDGDGYTNIEEYIYWLCGEL